MDIKADPIGNTAGYVLHGSDGAQESSFAITGAGLYIDIAGASSASTHNFTSFRTEETNSQYTPTERMRITSTGNVGIGDTSPTAMLTVGSGDLFQVNSSGAIAAVTGITTSGGYTQSGTSANTFTGTATFSNATYSALFTGGNVGVGTVTPSDLFTLQTASGRTIDINDDNSRPNIEFINGSTAGYIDIISGGRFGILSRSAVPLAFGTNDTDRMTISASGNVGIGSSTSLAKLQVTTTSNADGIYTVGGATNNQAVLLATDSSTGAFIAGGTAPNGTNGGNANDGAGRIILQAGPTAGLQFDTSAGVSYGAARSWTNRMTLLNSGNFGIGTTTPISLLSVSGDSYFFGNATTTGILNVLSAATSTFIGAIRANCFTTDGSTCLSSGGGGSSQWTTSGSNIYFNTGNVGIGSTTPYAKLTVSGMGLFDSIWASSTTATSTFAGNLNVGNGGIVYSNSTGITAINNLELGALNFETDGGVLSWVDMPLTASSTIGTEESYTAQLGSVPLLTVYGLSDGAGSITNGAVGIGTTTPTSTLTVAGTVSMIGLTTSASGDDAVCISATGEIRIATGAADCTTSSIRFKHDVATLTATSGLALVNQLRPVAFKYNGTDEAHVGFIAEEVAALDDRLIFTEAGSTTPRGVRYQEMTAILAKAIQELDAKVSSSSWMGAGSMATSSSFVASVQSALSSITEWVGQKITATVGSFKKVQVENGLEIKDQKTGDVYCVEIQEGDWVKTKGECDTAAQEGGAEESTPEVPAPEEPVVEEPVATTTEPVVEESETPTSEEDTPPIEEEQPVAEETPSPTEDPVSEVTTPEPTPSADVPAPAEEEPSL